MESVYHELPVIAYNCKAGHNFFIQNNYNAMLAKSNDVENFNYLLNKLDNSVRTREKLSLNCKKIYQQKFENKFNFNKIYSRIAIS